MSATRPPAFDDRFSTPIEASRRGAHRARPKPASAGLPVAAGVAVVLLVIGGSYVMLRGTGGVSDKDTNVAAASAAAEDPRATAGGGATKAPAAGGDADPEADPDAGADAGDDAAAPTKSAVRVNRDVRFKLLNSTSTSGLARRVKGEIEADGWKVDEADMGNSLNRGLAVTKIYYGRPGTRATALALKKDLGFGTVVKDANTLTQSDLTISDLAVVLGTDAVQ